MEPACENPARTARQEARILIAEDARVSQELTRLQLRQLGHDADVAANGQEALDAHRRHPYDIILMDCSMPEMDGFQASWTIRHREEAAEPPARVYIIAMTANTDADIRDKCVEAGMDDYISKPVKLSELTAALERAAAKSAKRTENAVIDVQTIAQLRLLREPNQPDALTRFVDLFLNDAPVQLEAMERAIARNDASSMAETIVAANSLKGSAANFGAMGMVNLCDAIEKAARSGFLSDAVPSLQAAREELARVKEALARLA